MAHFDIGAEINVITRKVMKDTELAMRQKPKLELILHTKYSLPFLNLCEDIKVAISGLKTRHLIFVIKVENHDLVLEQPFLNAIKFS